jgi:hypothetical protein
MTPIFGLKPFWKLQLFGMLLVLGATFAHAQDSRAEAGEAVKTFNNMFAVLAEQKQWDSAEPYLMRAMEIARNLPESVQLAEVEQNLALLEAHRGEFREAAQIMGDVIAIEGRTLNVDDPRIAQSLATYSGYFANINQKAQARQAQERRRAIRRTTF